MGIIKLERSTGSLIDWELSKLWQCGLLSYERNELVLTPIIKNNFFYVL